MPSTNVDSLRQYIESLNETGVIAVEFLDPNV